MPTDGPESDPRPDGPESDADGDAGVDGDADDRPADSDDAGREGDAGRPSPDASGGDAQAGPVDIAGVPARIGPDEGATADSDDDEAEERPSWEPAGYVAPWQRGLDDSDDLLGPGGPVPGEPAEAELSTAGFGEVDTGAAPVETEDQPEGEARRLSRRPAGGAGELAWYAWLVRPLRALDRLLFARRWIGYPLALALFFAATTALHFGWSQHIQGVDAAYHIRMATIYRDQGPLGLTDGHYPWTKTSVFTDHWADKEWLYHQALIPFTLGWQEPQPWVGTIESLDGPLAVFPEGADVHVDDQYEVRATANSNAVVGRFTVRSLLVSQRPDTEPALLATTDGVPAGGRLVSGDFERTAGDAPLRAGYALVPLEGASGRGGVIAAINTGVVSFPDAATTDPASPIVEGALLTLLDDLRIQGRAVLGQRLAPYPYVQPDGLVRFPFVVRHVVPKGRFPLETGDFGRAPGPSVKLPGTNTNAPATNNNAGTNRNVPATNNNGNAGNASAGNDPTANNADNADNAGNNTGGTNNAATNNRYDPVVRVPGMDLRPHEHTLTLQDYRPFLDGETEDRISVRHWVWNSQGQFDPAMYARHFYPSLAPWTGDDTLIKRGKLAAAFFMAVLLTVMLYVLRENGVGWPWLFVALLFIGSDVLWWRLFMCRPHVLSIAVILLGFHLILNRRRLALFVLAFVYALAYTASHALIALALLMAVTRLLIRDIAPGPVDQRRGIRRFIAPFSGREYDEHGTLVHKARLPLWVCAALGVALGFALHPNPVNNLHVWMIQNGPVYLSSFLSPIAEHVDRVLPDNGMSVYFRELITPHGDLRMGTELDPASTRRIGTTLWMYWLPALALLFLFMASRYRASRQTLLAFAVAAAFGWMFANSLRFMEYAGPSAALFVAFAVNDVWRQTDFRRFFSEQPWRANLIVLPACAFGLACVIAGAIAAHKVVTSNDGPPDQREVALAMRSALREGYPDGATVFTTDWHDFVGVFHYNTTDRYLVSLDPNFLYFYCPDDRHPGEIWRMWEDLRSGTRRIDDPALERAGEPTIQRHWIDVILTEFHSDVICCETNRHNLLANLRREKSYFTETYTGDQFVVFLVAPDARDRLDELDDE